VPEQGWKLHVSATILNANKILRRVAPLLWDTGTMFKAPVSLEELQRINCGLFYGFSQVGKFITVYPRGAAEACAIAGKLHGLVSRFAAPAVPFDARYMNHGCVFYRYGAFSHLELELADGTRQPAIRTPSNELVVDRRGPGAAIPAWVADPFPPQGGQRRRDGANGSLLKTAVRAYQALSQRGKGGVYRAFDTSVTPARPCILKEGRRHGETDWDGRDGYWRVRQEGLVLSSLRDAGVNVPEIYMFFKTQHHCYLALELVDGVNLQTYLADRGNHLTISEALGFGVRTAALLERIHEAGWVWRDCKPLNLLVTEDEGLRAVDFEGACPVGQPDRAAWGTPGYVPLESLNEFVKTRLPEDLYALGATLSQLFTGRPPALAEPVSSLKALRPDTPASVQVLVSALLDPSPDKRLGAGTVKSMLEREVSNLASRRGRAAA
jgi:class IV lanthipeptide synthase